MITKHPLISVIIPVYNAGSHLERCVNSLLNQTLSSLEFIFILDCPTDGSDLYIKEIAKKDPRVVVIENKINLHVGISRNIGLAYAQGEYIGFSDHDDWQDLEKYEKLYNAAKTASADIAMGVPCYVDETTGINYNYYYPNVSEDLLLHRLRELIIGDNLDSSEWNFYKSHGVIWDKIYKRDFLIKNRIQFLDTKVATYEDNMFLIEALQKANKITYLNEIVYFHRCGLDNTSSTYGYSELSKVVKYLKTLHKVIPSDDIGLQHRFYNSVISYITYSLTLEFRQKKNIPLLLRIIWKLRSEPIVKQAFKTNFQYLNRAGSFSFFGKIKNICIRTLITIL